MLPAWLGVLALTAVFAGAVVAGEKAGTPELTAAQIVEKNVAARGGLDGWHRIQSMVWVGHMESADPTLPRLTFALEQKRPNKTRFELSTMSQKTMRIFDGTHGWNVHPHRDGALDAQPYSAMEIQFAKQAQGIDGPLIDCQGKGISVELAGVEKIEGRKAYRLTARLPAGDRQDVWIDAETFLDLRYDRLSYSKTGVPGMVSVYYRDYRTVEGLMIPATLEIGTGSSRVPDKMVIEKISLNPSLDDQVFAKPSNSRGHRTATVRTDPTDSAPK
jgi:hypothetical protein